jgi:hypothetical protein
VPNHSYGTPLIYNKESWRAITKIAAYFKVLAVKFVGDFKFHRLNGDVTPSESDACDGMEVVSNIITKELLEELITGK